jgi:hypothetical protein
VAFDRPITPGSVARAPHSIALLKPTLARAGPVMPDMSDLGGRTWVRERAPCGAGNFGAFRRTF